MMLKYLNMIILKKIMCLALFLIAFTINAQNKKVVKSINLNGSYSIKTQFNCDTTHKLEYVSYYIEIEGLNAILSIGAKHTSDYWCEGQYKLQRKQDFFYAKGNCSDESDINDFMIKNIKNNYFIKSKRFLNKDWLEMKKE